MKLKMLVGLSGNEYALAPGDEYEFPEAEALRLIAAEYAVKAEIDVERAVAQPVTERRAKKAKAHVVSSEGDDATG